MSLRRRFLLAIAAVTILTGCASTSSPTAVAPNPAAPRASSSTATATSQRDQWLAMFARGYFPGRSGQVFVVPKEGDVITSREDIYRFMHGSPWDYDTRIPILFHGAPFVKTGAFSSAAKQQDIAPTVGAIVGVPATATYTGRVLTEAIAGSQRRAADRVGDRPRRDARGLFRNTCGRDADAHAAAPRWRVVYESARSRCPANGHRRRSRDDRHRQRSAHSRHHREHPVQPRHRQVAGGVRSARYARADGADPGGRVEPRHRWQSRDHRPGRRHSRNGRPGRPTAPASSARAR